MPALNELKLRLGVAPSDRSKDELLSLLIERAREYAKAFCRAEGDGDIPDSLAVEMAAHDYGTLGAEGIESRSASGLSERFRPDYPERVVRELRRLRRIGVPE